MMISVQKRADDSSELRNMRGSWYMIDIDTDSISNLHVPESAFFINSRKGPKKRAYPDSIIIPKGNNPDHNIDSRYGNHDPAPYP